ncbi:OmpA family outer membrane lipoprotein [Sulfitobacter noctilucicola]|uniref:Outer membrane protein OmpA-like peptidoglycan-associated protein n=1 Tax=Sulfitobacter noctilucicola TaxID=1342301 RepID=A0A7W6Q4P2_9RHOB|nr:OmpA family protein [Sulfitobacter noctilucicola]KIN62436.1 OmpA family outer membrane lipoprotein [Sulfitobacter noctilucicola]MBB4173032.1 outer membrane protein OmpA-like peptidoglycan-associated protein [Sulfitobacter noctilucicola]
MALAPLKTWLTVSLAAALGLTVAGAVVLFADQPASPTALQADAMANLAAPAAPGSHAIAEHDAPLSEDTCAQDIDRDIREMLVIFDDGEVEVTPDHTPMLNYIASRMVECDGALLQIAGHASGSGSDVTNIALSWARADETLDALVELGLDPASVEAVGFGARAPLAQGSDDDSAANRRVDFRVLPRRE